MAEAVHINKENLAQFQRWLLDLKPRSDMPAYKIARNLSFDLPLSVILAGAPTLPEISQEVIANVIANGRGYMKMDEDAETLLKLAESQPVLLGKTYFISGNSRKSHMYNALMDTLTRRPFSRNIPAIYVMMHYAPVYGRDVGTGNITKLSVKNTKLLNDIFANSDTYSTGNQFKRNANHLISSMDMSKLLNFADASPEFRARINAANFSMWNNNDKYEKMEKINPEFIDEQILLEFINTPMPKLKDLSGATSQKEKNANILPVAYTKPRDALMRLAEREEVHDRNDYGRTKTLTQRFKDLKARLIKEKKWPANNPNYDTLARDVYLKMIQRDIIDGRAADLSADEIQLALRADKNGFYVRHIPTNLLQNLELNKKQRALVAARNPSDIVQVAGSKQLSVADKRAAIANYSKIIDEDKAVREALEAELDQYDKDYEPVKLAGAAYQNASKIYTDLGHIQAAYKRIRDNLKNGAPNAEEGNLRLDALEVIVYNYLTGASDKAVLIPEQKGLPLFGRGAERERRERLEREIHDFNKILADVRGHMTDELASMLVEYRGAILSPESVSRASEMMKQAEKVANAKSMEFRRTHRNREMIERSLDQYLDRENKLFFAKAEIDKRQKAMRELVREKAEHNQSDMLIHVTDDMSPEKKRAARQLNRGMLQEQLALRRNRPARNIAEMLERKAREK